MNRLRWLILILGPLPIVGSSWAVSAWFKSEPADAVLRNDLLPEGLHEADRSFLASRALQTVDSRDDAALRRACQTSAELLHSDLGAACHTLARAPFVLGGDLTVEELAAWHAETIEPAVKAMQACYFDAPPTQPIRVLLFRDETSYNRYAQQLFGEAGISIYGYYKPHERTLLLNTATGKGTLLHELTHALMDFDFPRAPDWLNEGLASLHEQCRFRGGDSGPWIEGLVNWRLKGLKEVIHQGRLRTIEALAQEPAFRGPQEGTNYAQARYFCLYLQQKGLLADFYRAFRDNASQDPHGLESLAARFDSASWRNLDRDFQHWVLTLGE